jgi:hypothetical protein
MSDAELRVAGRRAMLDDNHIEFEATAVTSAAKT